MFFFNVYCIFFGFRAFYRFFIQFFAVILHSHSKSPHAHRTFIALPSHTRARVADMCPAGVPLALRAFQRPRPFQWRFARSNSLRASKSASGVPEVGAADNRTEIISPANKQYKGRKSLAAFQDPSVPLMWGKRVFRKEK